MYDRLREKETRTIQSLRQAIATDRRVAKVKMSLTVTGGLERTENDFVTCFIISCIALKESSAHSCECISALQALSVKITLQYPHPVSRCSTRMTFSSGLHDGTECRRAMGTIVKDHFWSYY